MTRESENAVPFAESERQAAELVALRRLLLASRGTFSLSVAICNSPALRDHLIQQLRATDLGIRAVSLPPETTSVLDFVRSSTGSSTPSAVFVTGLERALPSSAPKHPVLERLNGTRELWKEAYTCPIIFWLPEYAVRLLSMHARDLWAWRSHQFEFVSELAEPAAAISDSFAGDLAAAANLDADQKQFRVAELRERIAAAGDPPSPELTHHTLVWLNELAFLLATIGSLDDAAQTWRKALHMAEQHPDLQAMAAARGNLGNVLFTRGDLNGAEAMYRKALAIEEKLGRLEGMAKAYGNLGNVLYKRGDLDGAQRMHHKSLEIDQEIGRLDGMAAQYGNLGVICRTRGDLERAEEMHGKALEISEKIGRLEGVANQYGNLGTIRKARGDLSGAREYWTKARELFAKIGMQVELEKTQRLLDELDVDRKGK